MFPIFSQKGEVIGFGGRVLVSAAKTEPKEAGDDAAGGGPKYLNSPETPVFEKGRELYGLTHARRAIHDAGKVVVVEGYMDVVALAQHGIDYAVATLGTATTPNHVQKLVRHAANVIYCFDGDAAGHRAAWRALETSLPYVQDGRAISFLFLPAEHDPDSYVRAHGAEGFERALAAATPLSTYLLDTLLKHHDLATNEGRAALLQQAKPLLQQITAAPVLAVMLRKRLAELTGLSRTELDRLVGQAATSVSATPPARATRSAPSLVQRVLSLLLASPEALVSLDARDVEEAKGADKLLGRVLTLLQGESGVANIGALGERLAAEGYAEAFRARFNQAQRLADELAPEALLKELQDGLVKLRIEQRNKLIQVLTSKAQTQGLDQEERRQYQALIAGR